MDLTALEADISEIVSRTGVVLVREAGGSDYKNGGVMKDTSVDLEPIETKEDENGETRQVGVVISLEAQLMQTEVTVAFSNMQELTSGRVDLILSPKAVVRNVLSSTEAQSAGELIFSGRHLKIGGQLLYDGEESYLPASIEFRAPMSTIDTFVL